MRFLALDVYQIPTLSAQAKILEHIYYYIVLL